MERNNSFVLKIMTEIPGRRMIMKDITEYGRISVRKPKKNINLRAGKNITILFDKGNESNITSHP